MQIDQAFTNQQSSSHDTSNIPDVNGVIGDRDSAAPGYDNQNSQTAIQSNKEDAAIKPQSNLHSRQVSATTLILPASKHQAKLSDFTVIPID